MHSLEQTIVAVYDTPAHAELAVQDLLQAHVPPSAIERHTGAGSYLGETSDEPVRKPGGFLASLFGTESHADSTTYSESMSRGGTVVTVHGIPHEDFDRVAALLETHRPIEFDDGHAGAATAAPMTTGLPAVAEDDGGTLQLSEESLVVGKRLVNHGGTRIRRYVVETPVEAQVSLHDERVIVERDPVADGRAVDANAFVDNDRVIEMTESTAQAAVGKTARVVEEVSLRREGADWTETVRDTVREEEVEITDAASEGAIHEQGATSWQPLEGTAFVTHEGGGRVIQRGRPSPPSYVGFYRMEPLARIKMIKSGLSAAQAKHIVSDLDISQAEAMRALAIAPATMNRKIKGDERLPPAESERILGVARLVGQLQAMVDKSGEPQGFEAATWLSRWLTDPLLALGGVRPIDMLDTIEGQNLVAGNLARMQGGAYA